MLRLSLLENLRRIADVISANRREINSACLWVGRMMEVTRKDPKNLILVIADMARSDPPMTSAFVAEMARQLQRRTGASTFPLNWIEQRLSEKNQTIEQMIHAETSVSGR